MVNGIVQVPPDSTGKIIDHSELTVGANTAERQRINISDHTTAAAVAGVSNADPGASDYGLVIRDVRGNGTLPVRVDPTGTTVQPVSATALPLPTGAATAAKQPALGTAGAASADVISVQGIASMTALKTDGSGVTQPVSGTVTVQQSTATSLKVDLSGTAANTTAIKVDGSAVTQPVSVAATLAVQAVGNGSLVTGQQAVTASAQQLGANACRKVCLRTSSANSISVFFGASSGVTTSTGFELGPGEFLALDVTNTNLIWHIASTTGASFSWIATN